MKDMKEWYDGECAEYVALYGDFGRHTMRPKGREFRELFPDAPFEGGSARRFGHCPAIAGSEFN